MSNNYTKGCFHVPLSLPQVGWTLELHKNLTEFAECPEKSPLDFKHFIKEISDGYAPDLSVEPVIGGVDLWGYEYFSPEVAACFVQQIFRKFRLSTEVEFTYAWVSDRYTPGAFGGGGVVVNKSEIKYVDMTIGVKKIVEAIEFSGMVNEAMRPEKPANEYVALPSDGSIICIRQTVSGVHRIWTASDKWMKKLKDEIKFLFGPHFELEDILRDFSKRNGIPFGYINELGTFVPEST